MISLIFEKTIFYLTGWPCILSGKLNKEPVIFWFPEANLFARKIGISKHGESMLKITKINEIFFREIFERKDNLK